MQRKRRAFRDWDKGLVGRDQALEYLEGREPRLLNFLGFTNKTLGGKRTKTCTVSNRTLELILLQ